MNMLVIVFPLGCFPASYRSLDSRTFYGSAAAGTVTGTVMMENVLTVLYALQYATSGRHSDRAGLAKPFCRNVTSR